jgi:hypothetical protein
MLFMHWVLGLTMYRNEVAVVKSRDPLIHIDMNNILYLKKRKLSVKNDGNIWSCTWKKHIFVEERNKAMYKNEIFTYLCLITEVVKR